MTNLEITAEPVEPRQIQLTIVVPQERIAQAMYDVAQQFARRLKVPGYRPGRVPVHMVAAQVGEDTIKEEALERLTQEVVGEAIRQEELEPVAPMAVEFVSEDPLTYRAMVPLRPEVDLADYTAHRLPAREAEEITDETVDEIIDRWRSDLAYLAPVERAAEEDDVVTVALIGRHDDKIVFEEEAANLQLSEEGARNLNLPREVIDELIGLAAGERHEFEVKYSEFWPQQELQGETVLFEAEIAAVSSITLPELDDTLAHEVSDVETLDELREKVREQTELRAELESREAYVEAALDALVEGASVSYPPALLDSETADVVADLRSRVERQGITWERWLELQDTDEDQVWDEMEEQAERRLIRGLVLSEFVRAEGIELSDEEVQAEVDRLTALVPSGTPKKSIPPVDQVRRSAASRLLTNRALERLVEIVSDEDVEPPLSE